MTGFRLHAALPPRWRPYSAIDRGARDRSAREVVVVARPPFDQGGFCTTLLIAQDEAPGSVPIGALLAATESSLVELGDDVEVMGQRSRTDDETECVSRLVVFEVRSRGARVAQLHSFVAPRGQVDDRPRRPIVQFVGTCAFDELDHYGPDFVNVINSIRFVENASAPG